MEIEKSIDMDCASIIRYFIEGINDSRSIKAVLFETRNFNELKGKIKIYETIKGPFNIQNGRQNFETSKNDFKKTENNNSQNLKNVINAVILAI